MSGRRELLKVLLITPYYKEPHRGIGSAYKMATQLAQTMNISVLTGRTGGQSAEDEQEGVHIFRTRDIFIPDPFNFSIIPNLWYRTYKLVRDFRPDVVIISKYVFFTILAAPLLALMRQPFIITVDTFPGICWHSPFKARDKLVALYTRSLGRCFLNMAGATVLLHEGLLLVSKKIGITNAMVIHNGVPREAFGPHPHVKGLKRRGEVTITYVGRLESVKGWESIHRIAKRLVKQYKVRFLFVGNTQGKQVSDSEGIRFLGYREEVMSILQESDINVLFSHAEGLPNTVMEAMAAGVPVVASDVGGVSSLVLHEKTGLLVPEGAEAALESALVRLIEDGMLRRRLGLGARRYVAKNFHWDQITDEYQKLFLRLR